MDITAKSYSYPRAIIFLNSFGLLLPFRYEAIKILAEMERKSSSEKETTMNATLKTLGGILSALGALALNCSLFGGTLGVMVTVMQADGGE
jgi:hypothetical protein